MQYHALLVSEHRILVGAGCGKVLSHLASCRRLAQTRGIVAPTGSSVVRNPSSLFCSDPPPGLTCNRCVAERRLPLTAVCAAVHVWLGVFACASAGSTAGSLLASVGDAAKALLGGLMGPFEKEGAFEESSAVVTGGCCVHADGMLCSGFSSNSRVFVIHYSVMFEPNWPEILVHMG